MDIREHTIILKKSPEENIMEAECGVCGMTLQKPTDYHPLAFCVLVNNGYNPVEVVSKAATHFPKNGSVIQLQERA